MREYKFRAVIPEKNLTIYFDLDDLVNPKKVTLFSFREFLIPWLLAGNKPDGYTGFHDKNGVEIYEGDCLGGLWGNGHIAYCDKCKSFEYIANVFGCLSCSGDVHWNEVVEDDGKLEVIGNIWENPELLKFGSYT